MPVRWVPLEEVRDAVLAGRIHNATIAIAVLAALAARDLDWATLRAHDAPWPSHPAYRELARAVTSGGRPGLPRRAGGSRLPARSGPGRREKAERAAWPRRAAVGATRGRSATMRARAIRAPRNSGSDVGVHGLDAALPDVGGGVHRLRDDRRHPPVGDQGIMTSTATKMTSEPTQPAVSAATTPDLPRREPAGRAPSR